jgi:hypothetical protein
VAISRGRLRRTTKAGKGKRSAVCDCDDKETARKCEEVEEDQQRWKEGGEVVYGEAEEDVYGRFGDPGLQGHW